MVLSSSLRFFYAASLLLSASALPTRLQCRCIAISTSDPWPESPSFSSSSPKDICAHLGPELEYFRHAEPELYESYFNHLVQDEDVIPTPTDDEALKPLSTTVLMELAARNDRLEERERAAGAEDGFPPSAPTERPRHRIVCRSEREPVTQYRDSATKLFALKVVVALAILACVAECVNHLVAW